MPAVSYTHLDVYKRQIQNEFNSAAAGGKNVSLADLIVLGGCAAIEAAAKKAGQDVKVPFAPGRTDASQEQTDVHSFAVLELAADGFRNYIRKGDEGNSAELMVDKAQLLTLTAPEMTVLKMCIRDRCNSVAPISPSPTTMRNIRSIPPTFLFI